MSEKVLRQRVLNKLAKERSIYNTWKELKKHNPHGTWSLPKTIEHAVDLTLEEVEKEIDGELKRISRCKECDTSLKLLKKRLSLAAKKEAGK